MVLVTQNSFNLDLSRLQYKQSYNDGSSSPEANSLPYGFPIAVSTNLAWSGSGLTDESQYTYLLSKDEILEIEAALAAFKGMQSRVTRQPLPSSL
jgi:hypothetical protein